MIGKQIIVLLSLAFLAVVTLAAPLAKTAYINRFGKFVDLDTECSGRPCNYPKEIVPFSSQELSGPICIPTTNDQVICNSLPPNATLVSESEFDRIFPESDGPTTEVLQDPIFDFPPGVTPSEAPQVSASIGSAPQPSQTSKPSQVSHSRLVSNETLRKRAESPSNLEKRSRVMVDYQGELYVWPRGSITYGVASSPKLSTQISDLRRTVMNGMELWSRSCFPEASNFFANWKPTNTKVANVWFYFVDGTVCGQPAAVACAFSPEQYGGRQTIYFNYRLLVKKTNVGMDVSMAHELGHMMGLAHEIWGPKEEPSPIWKLSDEDPNSLMHPLYDSQKIITKTDCRLFKFYYENFKDLRCGFEGSTGRCKKQPKRNVIEPFFATLKIDEKMIGGETGAAEMIQDVADPNCLGSDPNKYILNQPHRSKGVDSGYTRRGFLLTQCLGVQDEKDPDYMYVLQSDGNFVSYNIKTKKAIWSTQSQGLGAKGSYSMFLQLDGNLVIYDAKGTPTWSSGSWHGSSTNFRIDSYFWYFKEGHMYLTDSSGRFAWATRTVLAHTNQRIEAKDVNGGHTGYCLDYSSKLRKCAGGNDYEFNIYTDGTIRSAKSGYCLYAPRAENEWSIHFGPCNPLDKLYLWEFPFTGKIKNRAANMCLDNRGQKLQNGNQIQVYECFDVWSENWWIGGIP